MPKLNVYYEFKQLTKEEEMDYKALIEQNKPYSPREKSILNTIKKEYGHYLCARNLSNLVSCHRNTIYNLAESCPVRIKSGGGRKLFLAESIITIMRARKKTLKIEDIINSNYLEQRIYEYKKE